MKGYKLVEEGKAHFHLEHPNGTRFSVAKSGIDAATAKKLKSMPKYAADGGVVPSDDEKPANEFKDTRTISLNEEKRKKVQASMKKAFGFYDGGVTGDEPSEDQAEDIADDATAVKADDSAPMSVEPIDDATAYQPPVTVPAPTPAAPVSAPAQQMAPQGEFSVEAIEPTAAPIAPKPAPTLAEYGNAAANIGQQAAGYQALADAKAKESQQVSQAHEAVFGKPKDFAASVEQMKKQLKDLSDRRTDIQNQNDALFKDIQTGKINPNKLWDNMSTGSKVGAAISMILGGAAAGLSGGPNQALAVIEKSIDRDIDSQKENLNKKASLFSQNMQRYHDLGAAENATRLQMNTALQAQIAGATARAQGETAKAQGAIAIGQLKMQAVPMVQNMAKWEVMSKSLGAGGQEGGIPVGKEPVGLLADKNYMQRRVVINGVAHQSAGTRMEQESLRLTERHYGPVKHLIEQLNTLGPSALVPGSDAALKAEAIRAKLATEIPQVAGIRNINLQEIEHAGDQVKNPAKLMQMLSGDAKNNQFLNNLAEEIESQRKALIPSYRGMESLPSREKGFK